MINIGIDFGTTNSILSYHNQERQALECFRAKANSNPYIPTAIFYDSRGTVIGEAAKEKLGNPEAYSQFKLLIESMFDEPMAGQEKKVREAARDYLQELLKQFQGAGNEIGKIVLTIPDAWYQKKNNGQAGKNLKTIFEEISMPDVEFQSEPVAAAAYYCWLYQYQQLKENPSQKAYDGNLLIIDYGGGTLDVTLCNVLPEKGIHVVESYGFGEEQGPEGCAGSAFDDEVVKILSKEAGISLPKAKFMVVKNELERKLIAHAEKCSSMLEEYYEYPEGVEDEEVFSLDLLDNQSVCCKHLVEAFNRVNRPVLEKAIDRIQEKKMLFEENLQVVMVGGFSNFFCVEATVRKLLGGRVGAADVHFSGLLNQENKALAVAKGAALIANHAIRVTLQIQSELGVVLYGQQENAGLIGNLYMPLIKEGKFPDDYETPVYIPEEILLMPKSGAAMKIKLYCENETERSEFTTEETIADILGDEKLCSGNYSIGAKINPEGTPMICLKAHDGKEYFCLLKNTPVNLL